MAVLALLWQRRVRSTWKVRAAPCNVPVRAHKDRSILRNLQARMPLLSLSVPSIRKQHALSSIWRKNDDICTAQFWHTTGG